MSYKILKKKKIIQMICSPSEIRMMYNLKRSGISGIVKTVIESPKARPRINTDQFSLEPRKRMISKSAMDNKKQTRVKSQTFAPNMILPPLKHKNHC